MTPRLCVCFGSLLLLAACDSAVNFRLPDPPAGPAAATLEVVEADHAPVLEPGGSPGGGFDSVDVLNPSIFRGPDGLLSNLYSGFDGKTWHTGLATAPDARGPWTKQGRVLSPDPASWEGDDYIAANGSALVAERRGEILYWYQAGRSSPQIGLAHSSDGGKSWRKEPVPVLRPGPYRSWDERGVADPYVIRAGEFYYLYYTGLDRAQRQQLGVARSRDGIHWEKNAANPILAAEVPTATNSTATPYRTAAVRERASTEEAGLGEPAVFGASGAYWMLYTGRAWDEQRRISLAKSPDGVHWTRIPSWIFSGQDAWDSKVVCDPTVEVEPDGLIRVWFGGGDVATPDERLHGRIGVVTLRAR